MVTEELDGLVRKIVLRIEKSMQINPIVNRENIKLFFILNHDKNIEKSLN